MSESYKRRVVVFVALAALFFATTAYLSHGYGDRGAHHQTQCELCVQFGGAAGAPSAPANDIQLTQIERQAIAPSSPFVPVRRNVDSRLPRGPPQTT